MTLYYVVYSNSHVSRAIMQYVVIHMSRQPRPLAPAAAASPAMISVRVNIFCSSYAILYYIILHLIILYFDRSRSTVRKCVQVLLRVAACVRGRRNNPCMHSTPRQRRLRVYSGHSSSPPHTAFQDSIGRAFVHVCACVCAPAAAPSHLTLCMCVYVGACPLLTCIPVMLYVCVNACTCSRASLRMCMQASLCPRA